MMKFALGYSNLFGYPDQIVSDMPADYLQWTPKLEKVLFGLRFLNRIWYFTIYFKSIELLQALYLLSFPTT